ncbi:MAG: hypothetical protein GY866_43085 [Proteobacteria bacterium]|nr:hypothetical protein [Pseudomonadota bacterium]
MRIFGLLIITLFLGLVSPATADILHNQKQQLLGGEAVGLGGTYQALSDDGAAVFYNPAVFMDEKTAKLSVSAESLRKKEREDSGKYESVDDEKSTLKIEPAFAGGISSFGLNNASWGTYTARLIQFHDSFSGKFSLPDAQGRTNTKAAISKQEDEQVDVLGITLSYTLNENLALGIGFSYFVASSIQGSVHSYSYDYYPQQMAYPTLQPESNFNGITDRIYLRNTEGDGIQPSFGMKYRTGILSVGIGVSLEANIEHKNTITYKYSTGLQYNGSGGVLECPNTLSTDDMEKCMFDREPLFVTENADYEGTYQETLPNGLKIGVALDLDPILIAIDLNHLTAVEYEVNTMGITETELPNGALEVKFQESTYTGKKKSVTAYSIGIKAGLGEKISLLGGYFADPGSREFDDDKLHLQIGMKTVDYSGFTLGFSSRSESNKYTFLGIVTNNGKGNVVLENVSGVPETSEFESKDTSLVLAYGAAF